jgi:hypothetical protein
MIASFHLESKPSEVTSQIPSRHFSLNACQVSHSSLPLLIFASYVHSTNSDHRELIFLPDSVTIQTMSYYSSSHIVFFSIYILLFLLCVPAHLTKTISELPHSPSPFQANSSNHISILPPCSSLSITHSSSKCSPGYPLDTR